MMYDIVICIYIYSEDTYVNEKYRQRTGDLYVNAVFRSDAIKVRRGDWNGG